MDFLESLMAGLIDPTKRVTVQFLVTSVGFIVLYRLFFPKLVSVSLTGAATGRQALTGLRQDGTVFVVNAFLIYCLGVFLVAPHWPETLVLQLLGVDHETLIVATIGHYQSRFSFVSSVLFTAWLFLLNDFSKFIVHRALHKFNSLWEFHKVHHSAESLSPLTVFRTHPLEALVFTLRAGIVQMIAILSFLVIGGFDFDPIGIFGANIFLFIFNVLGSNLRHSHVHLSYGRRLEKIFISPYQHQLHHSIDPRHADVNFGTVLAFWDRLFGSWRSEPIQATPLRYGLSPAEGRFNTLADLYLRPLVRIFLEGKDRMRIVLASGAFFLAALVFSTAQAADALNIYSYRQPFLIKPFTEAYAKKFNVDVKIVFAKKGLAQRLQAEGRNSPADVVLTVDIARIHEFADRGLLQPVRSATLTKRVPANLRAADNTWYGLSRRARVVIVNKSATAAQDIQSYEDLAKPIYKGRVCSRPGSHVYNRALLASLIAHHGEQRAAAWARGLVANFGRRPQGNDRAQIKAVWAGECDISFVNSYYVGKIASDPATRDWLENIRIIFPNQADRGTHINISGGGVARFAPHRDTAQHFLEWLTGAEAQILYQKINYEFPIDPAAPVTPFLAPWSRNKFDDLDLNKIPTLAIEAQKIIDRTGW